MARDFTDKSFQKVLRGYSPEDVDKYIAYINSEYRKLERRCVDSERKLVAALKKIDALAKNESIELTLAEPVVESVNTNPKTPESDSVINNAEKKVNEILLRAKAESDEIIRTARVKAASEAEKILSNAKSEAEFILSNAQKDALAKAQEEVNKYTAAVRESSDKIRSSAAAIYDEVCSFRSALFELYSSHIESVEKAASEAEKFAQAAGIEITSCKLDNNDDLDPDFAITDDKDGESDENASFDEVNSDIDEILLDVVESEPDEPDSEDEVHRRQLDKLFGLSDDADYDSAMDSLTDDSIDSDNDSDTRVLDLGLGEILRANKQKRAVNNAEDMSLLEFDDKDADFEIGEVLDESYDKNSLTDEFNIIFSQKNSQKSVEEIRRQPIIAPQASAKSARKQKKN